MGDRVRQALQDAWTRRGALAWALWPLSLGVRVLGALRRGLYQWHLLPAHKAAVPVVVVGNVVAGGAGKTPAVIAITQHLAARGLRPAVVSRGYGRTTRDCREVTARSTAREVGDEPLLIARTCGVPVAVAARRFDAVRAVLAAHPDTGVIVADDGLQHLALLRDVEICVFDERGVGNGFVLPAGPLREPWPRRPAPDIVLHSGERVAFGGGFTARRSLATDAVRADGTRLPLDSLIGQPVAALAGIARPERFFEMLRARGLQLAATFPLPDHHDFAEHGLPGRPGLPLLCTEKDAVKLWPLDPDVWAVPLVFTPEPALLERLDALLDARLSSVQHPMQGATNGHQTP
jgi:tetraacyldisaccharide 4'-kinase